MWIEPDDTTEAVITPARQLASAHGAPLPPLPETALVFFMGQGVETAAAQPGAKLVTERFHRFLHATPLYRCAGVCVLHGGWGAPMAADTVETLASAGVRQVVIAGMCGAFVQGIAPGDMLSPARALVAEGTSLHYAPSAEWSYASPRLHGQAVNVFPQAKALDVVSSDAVYRQTFRQEERWRDRGCAGVDMETSATFTVAACLGVEAVALLLVSDRHPLCPGDAPWDWRMTGERRADFARRCLAFAQTLQEGAHA